MRICVLHVLNVVIGNCGRTFFKVPLEEIIFSKNYRPMTLIREASLKNLFIRFNILVEGCYFV